MRIQLNLQFIQLFTVVMLDNIVFLLTLNLNDLTVVWLTACILKQLIRTHQKKNLTTKTLFRKILLAVNEFEIK